MTYLNLGNTSDKSITVGKTAIPTENIEQWTKAPEKYPSQDSLLKQTQWKVSSN
jgi:hypothetical protein